MKSGSSVSDRIVQEFTVIESIGERKKERKKGMRSDRSAVLPLAPFPEKRTNNLCMPLGYSLQIPLFLLLQQM